MRHFRVAIVDMEKQYVLYTVYVCVALVTQHAMRLRHIVCHLWSAQLYDIILHYLIQGMFF